LALSQIAVISALKILKDQFYLTIAISTTGAMFFYGCGAITGNNAIGKARVSTGDTIALPIKGVGIMWRLYANTVIQKVFGIPLILNMTQTFKTGSGSTIQEIRNYIQLNKTSLIKAIKGKIIKWLS